MRLILLVPVDLVKDFYLSFRMLLACLDFKLTGLTHKKVWNSFAKSLEAQLFNTLLFHLYSLVKILGISLINIILGYIYSDSLR